MTRRLRYSVVSPVLALGLLAAGQAGAQPPGPPPPPPQAVAPTPAGPALVYRAAPRPQRWGIGLHLGGMGVTTENEESDSAERETELGVVGVQLRYRLHRRWEIELGFSYMEGELPELADTRRSSAAITLGGMFHINPDSRWRWSVLFGIGAARDQVWYEKNGERVVQAEFAEGLGRLGIGLERRFDRWGLAAQLYGVGLERDEEELDGPAYVGRDGPVPEKSSGGLFQLVANYYF